MSQINYPHLASMVFNTPLMATPNLLNNVQQALIPRLTSSQTSFDLASVTQDVILNDSPDRTYLKTQAGIAIIPVQGILSTRGSGIDANCNLILSYEMLDAKLQAALNSDQVAHIVLDIDSNGGAAVGCFDFAERIYQARSIKPITAIVNYSAYSAAYMIACAASEIVLSTTSGVGSIGVIATHMDISKAAENQGVKFTTVYRGEHKNDLTPFEPISDQSLLFLNQRVDELYQLFVDNVASYRGIKPQAVIDTQAGVFMGKAAIQAGLADKLMHPQDAIDAIAQGLAERKASKRKTGLQAQAMAMQASL